MPYLRTSFRKTLLRTPVDKAVPLAAPVLVVWGEEDAWLDPSQADRLGEAIPDSRVKKMPGVGHFVPEDAPEELARKLSDFLAEGGARP